MELVLLMSAGDGDIIKPKQTHVPKVWSLSDYRVAKGWTINLYGHLEGGLAVMTLRQLVKAADLRGSLCRIYS